MYGSKGVRLHKKWTRNHTIRRGRSWFTNQNWSQETESNLSYMVNDGFNLFKIHSLPEKMLWLSMILFIFILAWKMTQEACPHWLPGNTKAKRRRRRQRRKEKLRRLLHSQGLAPLLEEDPYCHSWDRERGRNSSSSEEENGLQALTRANTALPSPTSYKHTNP